MPADVPYTAVLCAAPGCGVGDPATVAGRLVDAVRAVVRAGRYGVLVTAGCTLGPSACRLRPTAPVLLVQPCNQARRPVAPAVRVGPLRTDGDVAAVARWLGEGDLDPALLPAHLTELQRLVAAAPGN
ncbi:MAG TPA: hypothetical protein VM367_06200 [Pseudonocardia sp.]|jgi:hypothetical protein|nr:hypothetical protein [Pseudonocardia sp.]